jgi:hypothetical protein
MREVSTITSLPAKRPPKVRRLSTAPTAMSSYMPDSTQRTNVGSSADAEFTSVAETSSAA